jgi:predicted cation transporter
MEGMANVPSVIEEFAVVIGAITNNASFRQARRQSELVKRQLRSASKQARVMGTQMAAAAQVGARSLASTHQAGGAVQTGLAGNISMAGRYRSSMTNAFSAVRQGGSPHGQSFLKFNY